MLLCGASCSDRSLCFSVPPPLSPLFPVLIMATSTEHTESVREMFNFLKTQTATAETNNVAHATVTTNAWRDAVDMIPKTAGSLDTLLLQLGASAAPIVSQVGGVAIVKDSLTKLRGMKLVFDSATRQMLLKKAVTALTNLETSLNKLGAQTGGEWGATKSVPASGVGAGAGAGASSSVASSSNSSQSSGTGLYRPMPEIQKATIVFDPANMRTGQSGLQLCGSALQRRQAATANSALPPFFSLSVSSLCALIF